MRTDNATLSSLSSFGAILHRATAQPGRGVFVALWRPGEGVRLAASAAGDMAL